MLCVADSMLQATAMQDQEGMQPERRCQAALCHAAGGVQSMLVKEGVLWSKGVLSAPGVSAAASAPALEQGLGAAVCPSASGNGLLSPVLF